MRASGRVSRHQAKYKGEKLNIKKVIFVLFLPILILLIFLGIKHFPKLSIPYKIKRSNPKRYFTSFTNNNYGVIDENGNEVLKNEYTEYIVIPNKTKDLFIISYQKNDKKDFETKAINKDGNEVFKNFNKVIPIEYKNSTNKFDQNLLALKNSEGKIGFGDYQGNIIIEPKYDSFSIFNGIENLIEITENGKKGVLNTTSSLIAVAPVYKSVEPLNKNQNSPFIVVFENLKGVVSSSNKQILPAEFTDIIKTNSNKFFVGVKNNEKNIYNEKGKMILGNIPITPIDISDTSIIGNKDRKLGVLSFEKQLILPYAYDYIEKTGLDTFLVKQNNKFLVIKTKEKKNLLKNTYDNINYIKNANIYIASNNKSNSADAYNGNLELKLSGVFEEINEEKSYIKLKDNNTYKYYLFNFEEKKTEEIFKTNNLFMFSENGKIGYRTSKNQIIIPAIYDEGLEQNEYGYIAVSRNNKWGVLDHEGKTIIEPKYDFSEFIKINFINEWHLDKELELETYTK